MGFTSLPTLGKIAVYGGVLSAFGSGYFYKRIQGLTFKCMPLRFTIYMHKAGLYALFLKGQGHFASLYLLSREV